MKTKNKLSATFLIIGVIAITAFSSCTKPNGTATFWTNATDSIGYVTVTLNSTTSNITSDFSTTPDCGTTGTAYFSLPEGTYNYTAVETTTGANGIINNWASTVVIQSDVCTRTKLY